MIPKFRAWDTHEDVMNRVDYIDFANGVVGLSNENVKDYEQPIHRVKFMQSTGLKDKNGAEIFEGDIIPSNCNIFSKGELKVQVVRFLGGGFRRLIVYREWGPYGAYGEAKIADWHDGGCLSEEEARKTKVLGNIYEHPELLEVEE